MEPDKLQTRLIIFDGEEFGDWKYRTERFLDKEDLLELVQKGKVALQKECESEDGGSIAVKRRKDEVKLELSKKAKKCSNLIIERLSNGVLEVARDKETAKDIWDALIERLKGIQLVN